jgi:hypothetical protein
MHPLSAPGRSWGIIADRYHLHETVAIRNHAALARAEVAGQYHKPVSDR